MTETETRRALLLVLVAGIPYILLTEPLVAQSQDFGSIADNIRSQLSNFGQLAGGIAALAGICMFLVGLLKFRQYSANPQDPNNKLGSVIVYCIVGAALVALPEFMDVGILSLFGGGSSPTTTDLDGRNLFN